MSGHRELGRALLARLDAIDLEHPRVDHDTAGRALRQHLAALGIRAREPRWAHDPDELCHEMIGVRHGSPVWRSVVARRGRLLESYHHLDEGAPPPERRHGVVGMDIALIRRILGTYGTPRLVRVLTADLGYIARRLADGSMILRAYESIGAVEPLARAVEAGAFAFGVDAEGSPVVVPRPRLRFDSNGRLHDWDGDAAVEWDGGRHHYYWRGVEMTASAGRSPERLTPSRVLRWANAERRRVAIERFGWEWFLDAAGFAEVQQDDYGRLLRTTREVDGEAVTLVQVVNATAEPDGTVRRYVLRVPPAMRTAREAVAWTFQIDKPERYAPLVQS